MLPYVGLSEAPYKLCAILFAACRDLRGHNSGTTTRKTFGEMRSAAWMYPDFPRVPDHDDAPVVRKYFRRRLCSYIETMVPFERSWMLFKSFKAAKAPTPAVAQSQL